MRIPERRKALLRRKLVEVLPLLVHYLRGKNQDEQGEMLSVYALYILNEDPKEIAHRLTQQRNRPISAWWVRKQIRMFSRLL